MNIVLLAAKPFLPKGTRIVIRESTMPGIFLRQESNWPRLWGWIVRWLYRKADKVVCLSDAMAKELAEEFEVPRELLARIYNPLDFDKVRKLADTGGNPYCGLGPNLVTAGRLSREKGFDLLLQAMPTVVSVLPKAKLLVLGEGPMQEELEKQAKKLGLDGSVHLAGFQENPWRYFKHADVFVMPSRYEGMPNALLEALAVGAQAVAADCPGAVREIQGCEGRLVLAATEDPVALAKAILYSCGRAMAAGHTWPEAESVLRKFSLKQIVNQYAELL
jgi:glycosyltransferase involved in cell wall biosynthesis